MENSQTFLAITATLNKDNMAKVPEYLGKVMPVFAKHGGKPFGKFKTTNKLMGEHCPEMIGIIEFPNAEAVEAVAQDPEFQALSELRAAVFTSLNMTSCIAM